MTPWNVVQEVSGLALENADGQRVTVVVTAGMAVNEIRQLESELGFKLPAELSELLPHCSGVDGLLDAIIDFTGRSASMSFAFEEAFPRCVPLAGDGCGNFWVLDVSHEGAAVAPVFFACHDPVGFSWGRSGPNTEIRRHGDHRLFAYAAPVKRGLWARLTGRV